MDNEYWLNLCKNIGEKIFTESQKYLGKDERKKIVGFGHGGDKTLLLDDIIEKLIINEFKSTGKNFKLIIRYSSTLTQRNLHFPLLASRASSFAGSISSALSRYC